MIFRKRTSRKFFAFLFLLLTIESIVQPSISYALTTGPHQPEFISYEEPGAADLVNLVTGDFSFSIPLLEVPGPEGGFSVPLTYNAGIGPEQEASWVGLGWTLNAGAITREINQYPDDASGESQSVTVKDLSGVHGWSSKALGFGQMGWSSLTGHYGSISLGGPNINYNNHGISGVSAIGIGLDQGKMSFNGVQFAMGVMSLLSMVGGGANDGPIMSTGALVATNIGLNMALSALPSSPTTPNAPAVGYWQYSKHVSQKFLYQNYWVWLDETRNENMYGVANLGQVPTTSMTDTYVEVPNIPMKANNQYNYEHLAFNINGVNQDAVASFLSPSSTVSTSDINYYVPVNVDFAHATSAATLAVDNFSVKAPGISGSIFPYRLDVGSVSMPRAQSDKHIRLLPVLYNNYKTPFVYRGSLANSYLFHTGQSSLGKNFGLSASLTASGDLYDFYENIQFTLLDPIFTNPRFGNTIKTTPNPDPNSFQFPQENHVEWMSNQEIIQSANGFANGFMDYFSTNPPVPAGLTRTQFRQSYPFTVVGGASASGKSLSSIGGFSITSGSGLTYHFALPSYDYQSYSYMENSTDATKNTTIARNDPFANTWMLTGITGSDFVDRNSNGVIDVQDWGYWVKFNYTKDKDNYKWQIPYAGASGMIVDETGTYKSYSSGLKQTYYLNSIETRSHVALFLKTARNDNYDATLSVGTLGLSEIALLKREDYAQLIDPNIYGFTPDSGTITSNWSTSNFLASSTAGQFKNSVAIKRIVFNQTYDLCPGTSNSVADHFGKLTLKSVSILGPNSTVPIVPNYKFDYNNHNPTYTSTTWDGWGMYNPNGTSSPSTHSASYNDADAAAWSLSTITTPLGSTINVSYERDSYGYVSGADAQGIKYGFNSTLTAPRNTPTNTMNLSAFDGGLQVNDFIRMTGTVSYSCSSPTQSIRMPISGDYQIQSILGNQITIVGTYGSNGSDRSCSDTDSKNLSFDGTIRKLHSNKGGNLRVTSIVLSDQGTNYKTSYVYTNPDGTSTGSVSQEPDYTKTTNKDFGLLPGYPMTPVMYSSVAVLTGNLSTSSDYVSKTVYAFEPPNSNMISLNYDSIQENDLPLGAGSFSSVLSVKREITDNTEKMGSLNSISVYDVNSNLKQSTNFYYTSTLLNSGVNNYEGYYSGGTLMFDDVIYPITIDNDVPKTYAADYKMTRTTSIKYPYTLAKVVTQIPKVVTQNDMFTTETDNISWDFLTGQVVEKNNVSASGIRTKQITIPAYTVYAGMGSKGTNIANSNMLDQSAANYGYLTDNAGNITGLLSGSVQTWKSDWDNYRYLRGSAYVQDGNEMSPNPQTWRKDATIVYRGSYSDRQSDGSLHFINSNNFNFNAGATNIGWLATSAVILNNRYSFPLESENLISGIHSSTKMDFSNKLMIASASNASYNEIAFSGAEDLNTTSNYFGGEVALGNSSGDAHTVPSPTHTGSSSVSLSSGHGFVFSTSSLTAGRTYRASVWTNSNTSGKIYYRVNGGSEVVSQPSNVSSPVALGTIPTNWYQINIEFTPTSTTLEIGVESAGGQVLFDDFRFQPADSPMTANVYDNAGRLQYSLDNNNLYTRFSYDNAGIVTSTYSESIKYGGEKLVSQKKYDYKRFHINP